MKINKKTTTPAQDAQVLLPYIKEKTGEFLEGIKGIKMNKNKFVIWNLRKIALTKKTDKINSEMLKISKKILKTKTEKDCKKYAKLLIRFKQLFDKQEKETFKEFPLLEEIGEDIPGEANYIFQQYIALAHILEKAKTTPIEEAIKKAKETLKNIAYAPRTCCLPPHFESPPPHFEFYLLTEYLIQKGYTFKDKIESKKHNEMKRLIKSIKINHFNLQKIKAIRQNRNQWSEIIKPHTAQN